MSPFVISQIIAAFALGAGVLSFQLKKREHIVMAFALMSAFYSIHFYFLGQNTASAIVAVSCVRFLTSAFTKRQIFMYFFIALTLAVGWYTYSVWYNLVAIAAGLLGVVATFQQNNQRLRTIMMSSNATMALHDAIVWSPVGVVLDLTIIVSGLVGYYRYHIAKTEAPEPER